ncbi:MAG: 23S rRNA (guanosine(2251)-2'-O)-methyltransferase RlmB [Syntrophales bacterium]|jgi:23S rRNA (guanosine2251-2'-O)-methyltransferase|nr:23S rRNA (guanosine(2251)-2'-O)-methyltransferase RlmB [Syntrophales bacterium]MDD4338622.1 23S rRNA (guanosine(2251)-2'-O)-methyltransferase RlmB [Syntrophales bacterium]HOG07708.1 23S rRNA (guanosine(2251)-2'-O)-methyltransferase RlmB [Syntrophales bacterium]HOS78168.1 23S rRNA (guanosine(2251)-2'-O)-methyltransferase RlmB [Syntrophales bacterium]HPB71014.1 23S rRNA (guanosine(2251)-2'-O)-methyltransferase RlmB [Syntrophales bacterium]
MRASNGGCQEILYGINPVREALRHGGVDIREIWVTDGRGGAPLTEILEQARQRGIPVAYRRREELDRRSGVRSHQGLVAVGRAFAYADLEEVVANRHEAFRHGCLLILDGVLDPQNLGSLIRTAHCFGVNGVIIPENRAAAVSPAAVKASAGAAGHIPVARVVNLVQTIQLLKDRGFWIYGADTRGGRQPEELVIEGDIALVMGSEGKGIRPLVRRQLDFPLSIPLVGCLDSLNVSVAAGIILHAIMKQRTRQ